MKMIIASSRVFTRKRPIKFRRQGGVVVTFLLLVLSVFHIRRERLIQNESFDFVTNETIIGPPLQDFKSVDIIPQPSLSDQFTQCILNLERDVLTQSQIDEWDKNIETIPYSVKIYDNTYWILGLALDDHRFDQFQYSCNDVPGAELYPMTRKLRKLVLLQCPSSVDPRTTSLKSFSSTNRTSNAIVQTYDMTLFEECERKDIAMFQERSSTAEQHSPSRISLEPPEGDNKDMIKVGVTACFVGEREKAMQWAAYHRALGVDHIWLYVNEDWDGASNLPQRDYITWVPWNFHVSQMVRKHLYPFFKFQVASMNDALWRAKRMDMDWIATIDIDEYVTLYNGTKVKHNSLKDYFKSLDKLRWGLNISSIEMKSLPFGTAVNIEKEKDGKELVIDFVHRNNMDVDDETFHKQKKHFRAKQFLHVKHVLGIDTHFINENKGRHHELASILRVNHYKNPEKHGVFRASSDNLIEDTLLRDSFRDAIQNEI